MSNNKAKAKGDRFELMAAYDLTLISGYECRRMLGAGRKDDVGDIAGLPNTTIQVKAYKDIARAVRVGPLQAEQQKVNAGNRYAFTMVRIRGDWRVVMTMSQMEAYLRDSCYGV